MPPRRRQPRWAPAQPPRRSERLRVLREASSARSAIVALRASANTTPTNMPIARPLRSINPPRRRPRIRRRLIMDSLVLVHQARRETADAPPPIRPRGLLEPLHTIPPGDSQDNPTIMPSRSINPPRRRRRDSIDIALDRQARREADAAHPPFRLLEPLHTIPPGGSQDNPVNPTTASVIRTSTPTPASEAMAGAGVVPRIVPFAILLSPQRSRPAPPTVSVHRAAVGRLQRELLDFMQEPPEGCQAELVNDNVFHWRARIAGPAETPYEGGQFHLDLHFPHDYPFSPPKIYFLTKTYHCNIAPTGYICLDILNREWSPALTVAKLLLSITSLLADPNPDDPLEPSIASLYKRHRRQHDQTARAWTTQYAKPGQGPPNPEYD